MTKNSGVNQQNLKKKQTMRALVETQKAIKGTLGNNVNDQRRGSTSSFAGTMKETGSF
jgi:hypothetical protein